MEEEIQPRATTINYLFAPIRGPMRRGQTLATSPTGPQNLRPRRQACQTRFVRHETACRYRGDSQKIDPPPQERRFAVDGG